MLWIRASGTDMGASLIQIIVYAVGGCLIGGLIGSAVQALRAKRRIAATIEDAKRNFDLISGERDALAEKNARSKADIQRLQAANAQRSAKLTSAVKKSNLLARDVRTLRKERENTKIKVSAIQNALVSMQKKSTALQSEFAKAREFYKRELMKSLEKRKVLEEEVRIARAEQEAFARQVESSTLEHGSTENMIVAAQLRLGQLQLLERSVSKLDAENEQLRDEIKTIRRKLGERERDLQGLEELKLHNKQLVRCVEALEGSRQEYEADAERYREQADQTEKESDTLRLKLEDLEKNFADIEKQQRNALEDARDATVVPILRKQS